MPIKSHRILRKLIISLIFPAVAIILVISLFFSYIYSRESMDDINSISFLTLSNVGTALNNLLESANQTTYALYLNSNISPLLYSKSASKEDVINALNYLRNVITASPQLDSIYLYANKKLVLNVGGSYLFNENAEDVAQILPQIHNFKPMPRQVRSNNGTLNLITSVYTEYSNINDGVYVIANYKADNLLNQIGAGLLQPGQNLIIADRDGNILAHNNKEQFAKSIAGEEYFRSAMSSQSAYGSLNTSLDGKPAIVNYLLVNNKSYVILFISESKAFFGKITSVRNTILLFCLAVFLLLAGVSIYISYRVYNPINNVFSNIRTLFGGYAGENSDRTGDIKFISGVIGNVVERLNNLEQDSATNLSSLKSSFVRNVLVSQARIKQDDFEKGMEKYGIFKVNGSLYKILVIRIDHCKEFHENNSKESIGFQLGSIESILCETLKPGFECSSVSLDSEQIILFASCTNPEKNQSDSRQLVDSLGIFQDTVTRLFNLSLTVGVSGPLNSLCIDELRMKYTQAYHLTNYRLVYGSGRILEAGGLKTQNDNKTVTAELAEAIAGSVKTGSLGQFESTFTQLFETIQKCNYERILDVLVRLAETIMRIPTGLQPNNVNSGYENIEQIYSTMKGFENYEELKSWFTALFEKTNILISGMKNKKATDLFDMTIKYINEYYCDTTLSASYMAEKLGISPQYFSKSFKQFTGMNFPDYINNLRLEKAKSILLSNPMCSITEVCQKSGYNSTSYFATAFTKKYGIPPSKYALSTKETTI